jgi:hypothetical protein
MNTCCFSGAGNVCMASEPLLSSECRGRLSYPGVFGGINTRCLRLNAFGAVSSRAPTDGRSQGKIVVGIVPILRTIPFVVVEVG